MAKVLRCPACGALWRVKDDFAADMLHCTECQACFSADKTESLSVPDEKLDARLQQAARRQAVMQEEAREGEAVMSRIADSLTDFDARTEAPEAPPARRARTPCARVRRTVPWRALDARHASCPRRSVRHPAFFSATRPYSARCRSCAPSMKRSA